MTQTHEVSKLYWKNGAKSLAQCRGGINLHFVRKNTIICKAQKSKSAVLLLPV